LDQNAYNNMSKFGNMSKPKKNDEQDANGASGGKADIVDKEDTTSELAEAALVVEKSAARSVRSEPPPDEDGEPSAVQDSETRNSAGNMELNQQQQYKAVTTERAEPVEERILCSTTAVPAAGETAAEVRRALCAGGGEDEEVVEAMRDVLGAQEQHWQELQGDFKFVEYLINLINPMQGN